MENNVYLIHSYGMIIINLVIGILLISFVKIGNDVIE